MSANMVPAHPRATMRGADGVSYDVVAWYDPDSGDDAAVYGLTEEGWKIGTPEPVPAVVPAPPGATAPIVTVDHHTGDVYVDWLPVVAIQVGDEFTTLAIVMPNAEDPGHVTATVICIPGMSDLERARAVAAAADAVVQADRGRSPHHRSLSTFARRQWALVKSMGHPHVTTAADLAAWAAANPTHTGETA